MTEYLGNIDAIQLGNTAREKPSGREGKTCRHQLRRFKCCRDQTPAEVLVNGWVTGKGGEDVFGKVGQQPPVSRREGNSVWEALWEPIWVLC